MVIKQIPSLKINDDKSVGEDRELEESVESETTILKMLKHPNIIQYYDSFTIASTTHIVMEYAEGSVENMFC